MTPNNPWTVESLFKELQKNGSLHGACFYFNIVIGFT